MVTSSMKMVWYLNLRKHSEDVCHAENGQIQNTNSATQFVNQLYKFSTNIAELSKPPWDLLSSTNSWIWGSCKEKAFEKIKAELIKPTVLAPYDVDAKNKIIGRIHQLMVWVP